MIDSKRIHISHHTQVDCKIDRGIGLEDKLEWFFHPFFMMANRPQHEVTAQGQPGVVAQVKAPLHGFENFFFRMEADQLLTADHFRNIGVPIDRIIAGNQAGHLLAHKIHFS